MECSYRKTHRLRVILPRPERARTMQGTAFGWADARLYHDCWLQVLSTDALATYLFLCLVADRQGVSFYRRDRISRELGLSDSELFAALDRLKQLDLVAYTPFGPHASDGFHQVLSLPPGGPPGEIVRCQP